MKKCILLRLSNSKLLNTNGASESFLVEGKLQDKEVIVKISLRSEEDDNSLEVERKMYMYVKEELSKWSPHLLSGIESGQCNINILNDSKISNKIKEAWTDLVNPEIDVIEDKIKLKRKSQKENQKPKHKNSGDIDDYEDDSEYSASEHSDTDDDISHDRSWEEAMALIENSPKDYQDLNKLFYIVTPKMQGENLFQFLEKKEITTEIASNEISLQVAQALSVFEKFKIKHNDLHLENIFIEVLKEEILLKYQYPFEYELKTKYKITIFDYDKVSFRKKWRNTTLASELCESQGICDTFVKNFDWYTYLTYLIGILEDHSIVITELRRVYGGNNPINIKTFETKKMVDSALGYACICTEVSKSSRAVVCKQCNINILRLQRMIGPTEFIRYKKKKNSISSEHK